MNTHSRHLKILINRNLLFELIVNLHHSRSDIVFKANIKFLIEINLIDPTLITLHRLSDLYSVGYLQIDQIQELFFVRLDEEDSSVDVIFDRSSWRRHSCMDKIIVIFSIICSTNPWAWTVTPRSYKFVLKG